MKHCYISCTHKKSSKTYLSSSRKKGSEINRLLNWYLGIRWIRHCKVQVLQECVVWSLASSNLRAYHKSISSCCLMSCETSVGFTLLKPPPCHQQQQTLWLSIVSLVTNHADWIRLCCYCSFNKPSSFWLNPIHTFYS